MTQAIPKDELELWIENWKHTDIPDRQQNKLRDEIIEELEALIEDTEFEAFDMDNPPEPPSMVRR